MVTRRAKDPSDTSGSSLDETPTRHQRGDQSDMTLSDLDRPPPHLFSKLVQSRSSPIFAVPALPDRSQRSEPEPTTPTWSSISRLKARPNLYGNPGRGVKGAGNHVHHEQVR